MPQVTLDERGRFTMPKSLRERYGEHYHVVELDEEVRLIPYSEDPLTALREEFNDVEESAEDLRDEARKAALEDAGQ